MNDNVDQVVQRTRQYWFSDGIVELSVGGLFLILGIYFYLQFVLPANSLLLVGLQVGFVVLLVGGIFLNRYLVNKIKSRLTIPRTGFVSYKRATRKQRLVSFAVVCIIAGINVVLFLTTPLSLNWIPAITGLLVGSLWLISAFRVGLLRFYLESILAYLLGIILSISNLDIYLGLCLFYGILGCILLLSGAWTLVVYINQHPLEEKEPQT